MGNQAQLENVKKLLETSPQVTSSEREEWLSLLPFMNDKQLMELVKILESPVNASSPAPIAPPAIPASAMPTPDTSNSISEVLKRNMPLVPASKSNALSTSQARVSPMLVSPDSPKSAVAIKPTPVLPVVPKPDTGSNQAVATPMARQEKGEVNSVVKEKIILEEVMPETKSLEDAGRLNVATLRGRGTVTVEAELVALCKKFGYFSVLFALESSPLYKTYLNSGNSALQNHESYEQAETKLSSAGLPYLTKPEFEEVNDLLQRLKHA